MNNSDKLRISELKALCDNTSKGPWFTPYNGTLLLSVASDSQKICICIPPADINHKTIDNNNNNNFEFIAESRTAIPWLIEMVEKQQKQIAVMKEALEDAIDGLANAVDDLQNCFDSGSVPIIDEVKSCRSYLTSVREALAEVEKLEEGK